MTGAVVTSSVVYSPGPEFDEPQLAAVTRTPVVAPEQAHTLLGRKGLLGKDRATRLALCAVHHALTSPSGHPDRSLPEPDGPVAVVVTSRYGVAKSVCDVVTEVRAGSARDVSPLQIPNVSSNVVASTIAIRHGMTGPNLTTCGGVGNGFDALRLALLLLSSRRAARAVLVGVEPADEVTRRLLTMEARPGTPARDVAVCLVLDPADRSQGTYVYPVERKRATAALAGLRLVAPVVAEPAVLRLERSVGRVHGTLDLVHLAVGAAWVDASADHTAYVSGDCGNGWRASTVLTASPPERPR
ncbi:beta-ketoacyl synthase N-terminal-like domain-containing protein [Salinispora vitiensis]|uniref:beta-ketoacyl synthase N-terminal-like domain-containing protein n=1 Tax=Salinispora vitiensis TaxID=999544 RepID=UPI000372F984|nr:beta-ketoacyl synthase N-terminal-like domain-containing protein [Salinispora vitiensis]